MSGSTIQVFGIQNPQGEWYTGQLRGGVAVFSSHQGNAIEMDSEECDDELKSKYMPPECKAVVLREFVSRRPA